MKKLAIGCVVILIVAAVAGTFGAYWLYRRVTSSVSGFAEVGKIPELDKGIRNTASFTPPASGELTADQVERLVKVQDAIRARIGARFDGIEQRYKALLDSKHEATAFDLPQLISAYSDLASTWKEAKEAQVEALNAVNLSLAEYLWVRTQAYKALGLPIMTLDLSKVIDDIKQGRSPADPTPTLGRLGRPERPGTQQEADRAVRKEARRERGIVGVRPVTRNAFTAFLPSAPARSRQDRGRTPATAHDPASSRRDAAR